MLNIVKSLGKCKSETTVIYYFIHTRTAIIKRTDKHKCWLGHTEIGTLIHCWWEYKLVQPLWKTGWQFLKNVRVTLRPNNSTPRYKYRETKTYVHTKTCALMSTEALFIIVKN